jgi:hypothetical protein
MLSSLSSYEPYMAESRGGILGAFTQRIKRPLSYLLLHLSMAR